MEKPERDAKFILKYTVSFEIEVDSNWYIEKGQQMGKEQIIQQEEAQACDSEVICDLLTGKIDNYTVKVAIAEN